MLANHHSLELNSYFFVATKHLDILKAFIVAIAIWLNNYVL